MKLDVKVGITLNPVQLRHLEELMEEVVKAEIGREVTRQLKLKRNEVLK